MRKRLLCVLAAVAAALLSCTVCAGAAEADEILSDFEGIIPEESGVTLDTDGGAELLGVESLLTELVSAVNGELGRFASFFLLVFGLAVVISVAENARPLVGGGQGSVGTSAVLTLAGVSIFSALYALLIEVRDGLSSVVDFFSAAIPTLTAVNAASGATISAATQAVNMNITLAVMERLSVSWLMPLSFAVFTLSFIGSVYDNGIGGVCKGVRSVFTWGVGIVSTVLAAVISIQSVVASAQDSATLRAARYAASGTIPIVGSTVASALATLGGGMAIIKSTVGAAAVAVILTLALSPLVALLLYRLALVLCTTLLEFSGSEGGVRCFSALRASLDAVIAVYSMSVLVCIAELVVFIKGGASYG